MKRRFEMQLVMNCVNCVVKARAQGTTTSIFLFIDMKNEITTEVVKMENRLASTIYQTDNCTIAD